MAVFINIHHFINHPAKDKISKACTKDHSKTEPHIVRHKDQHEEITDSNLHNMKNGLNEMMPVEYSRPEIHNINNTWWVWHSRQGPNIWTSPKLWNKVWSVTPYTLLLLLNFAFFATVKKSEIKDLEIKVLAKLKTRVHCRKFKSEKND